MLCPVIGRILNKIANDESFSPKRQRTGGSHFDPLITHAEINQHDRARHLVFQMEITRRWSTRGIHSKQWMFVAGTQMTERAPLKPCSTPIKDTRAH